MCGQSSGAQPRSLLNLREATVKLIARSRLQLRGSRVAGRSTVPSSAAAEPLRATAAEDKQWAITGNGPHDLQRRLAPGEAFQAFGSGSGSDDRSHGGRTSDLSQGRMPPRSFDTRTNDQCS